MIKQHWQKIVIAIGLIVGLVMIIYTIKSGGGPTFTYGLTLVDAETGEGWTVPDWREANIILPALRPGTKDKYALIEVSKDPSTGKWHINDSGKRMYKALNVPIKAFDTSTGELTAQPSEFKKFKKQQ
jgi:hypothetical protein